jgi:pimeloyl-ACP methyl ester carboxylesterase
MEYVEIGGIKQCVVIRSYNTDNPILLYVHGGPGTPELPLLRKFNSELEKHFTLVYWEQRGTGKSFNSKLFKNLQIDDFVNDGIELTNYLLKRFNKEKLIIMGHSWGTIISTKLVLKHPEKYHAYIGIGQIVDMKQGEHLSFRYTLAKAKEENNIKAIKALTNSNNPEYLTIDGNTKWYKQLKTQRKWLTYYGGVIHKQKDFSEYSKIYMKSKEYSLFDMVRFARGSVLSLITLWPEIMKVNLMNGCTEFQIPVYLIQGKHDYNCPTELVQEYFNQISAPQKQLILFENSAHNPIFEESERFNEKVVEILLK